jgi:hypothetical protein
MCEGGRGVNLSPNDKAKSSLQQLSNGGERGGGGLAKELEPDYEPERGTYFGQKALVPTFAARLLEPGKGFSVERRLAINDDLKIGNYIALHCKRILYMCL